MSGIRTLWRMLLLGLFVGLALAWTLAKALEDLQDRLAGRP